MVIKCKQMCFIVSEMTRPTTQLTIGTLFTCFTHTPSLQKNICFALQPWTIFK